MLFLHSQSQLKDWRGVLVGDFDVLKKENIKTLVLKKDGKIMKTSILNIEKNSIVSTDSLGNETFTYNNLNQIISLQSNKFKRENNYNIDYENNLMKTIWIESKTGDNIYIQKFSYPDLKNKTYKEFEFFTFGKSKNDTLSYYGKRYFFNKIKPELSYSETYKKEDYRARSYFNKVDVFINYYNNGYTKDSLFFENGKEVTYRYEKFGDRQTFIIKRDSVFTQEKVSGKIFYEKIEFNNLIFKAVKYNNLEKIDFIKKYNYFKNSNNKDILWEVITLDGDRKIINKEFPNKNFYRVKKGILVNRKNNENIRKINCGGYNYNDHRILPLPIILVFSPSILSSNNVLSNFNNIFDTSAIDLDDKEDIVFSNAILKDKEVILQNKSNVYDLDNELKRTMKSTFLWRGKIEKLIKGITIETETFKGKKYRLNLEKNPELFSLQIFIFILNEND